MFRRIAIKKFLCCVSALQSLRSLGMLGNHPSLRARVATEKILHDIITLQWLRSFTAHPIHVSMLKILRCASYLRCNEYVPSLRARVSMTKIPHCVRDDGEVRLLIGLACMFLFQTKCSWPSHLHIGSLSSRAQRGISFTLVGIAARDLIQFSRDCNEGSHST
jgi:hypothetical protein